MTASITCVGNRRRMQKYVPFLFHDDVEFYKLLQF